MFSWHEAIETFSTSLWLFSKCQAWSHSMRTFRNWFPFFFVVWVYRIPISNKMFPHYINSIQNKLVVEIYGQALMSRVKFWYKNKTVWNNTKTFIYIMRLVETYCFPLECILPLFFFFSLALWYKSLVVSCLVHLQRAIPMVRMHTFLYTIYTTCYMFFFLSFFHFFYSHFHVAYSFLLYTIYVEWLQNGER